MNEEDKMSIERICANLHRIYSNCEKLIIVCEIIQLIYLIFIQNYHRCLVDLKSYLF